MTHTQIGIDTNTKYFAIADANGEFRIVGPEKARMASERLPRLFTAFCDFLEEWQPSTVWVEEYAFVRGSRSVAEIAQAVAAVRYACELYTIPCHTLQNTLWKKEIIGNGNASKDELKAFLVQHYGLPVDLNPPDLYDAFGVLQAGLRRTNTAQTLDNKKKRR